jgi:leucyl aminopeptidase
MNNNLEIKSYNSESTESMPLAVFVYSDKLNEFPSDIIKDENVEKLYHRIVQDKQITGKPGEAPFIYSLDSKFSKFYFIGIGNSSELESENFRKAGAALCRRLRKFNINKVAVKFLDFAIEAESRAQAFIEGFMLRNYDFFKYREKSHEGAVEELYIYENNPETKAVIDAGVNVGRIVSKATNFCRDIANEPANFMTPEIMAERALEIAAPFKPALDVQVFERAALEELQMGCFLGVAKAGGVPPRMITLEYKGAGEDEPYVALVGKGITFDSGGISLKNSAGMFHMKRDMSGAAAVISAMSAVAELKLKVNVIAVVGATENMPGSNAYKPGDILKSMNGKTVEIINTDAEGRLVLADLLTYVQRKFKPACLIDLATLTGAVQRALGGAMSGAFTNNKELLQQLMAASEKANEPLWELPLGDKHYKGANKSYFADLKNSSDKPPGGTKAALFLYEFIENDLPWVHLDIAGTDTASGEPASYYPRGATGVGTRTIVEFLRNRAGY